MSQATEKNGSQSTVETSGLFSEFSASTYEEWRQAAEKVLKGAPFEKRLITKTYEAISLQPIYMQQDVAGLPHMTGLPGFPAYARGTRALGYLVQPWDICQELPYGSAEEFNQAVRHDLEYGQSALNLLFDRATLAGLDADQASAADVGQGGLSVSSLADLAQALAGIDLAEVPITLQSGALGLPLAALLIAVVQQQGTPFTGLRGSLGMDPLGTLVRTGTLPTSLADAYSALAALTAWAEANTPQLQTIAVQGHPYHDGGASAVQELAFALATGVEYLRELQARGLAVEEVAPRVRFSLSIGSHFFMEIAKLRAARLLWAQAVAAFGGSQVAQQLTLHGRTSAWTKTATDPYVNMLRATAEAFAGVMGGCDSLHVSCFDEPIGLPDEFSRRIARNCQVILRQECSFGQLVDPAGGSWYIEKLTDEVAQGAWALFQQIERQGGMAAALQAGFPQAQVAGVAAQRAAGFAQRKDVLVGTNMYANAKEKALEPRLVDGAALQQVQVQQLSSFRAQVDAAGLAAALEQLAQAKAGEPAGLVTAAVRAAAAGATLGALSSVLHSDQPAPTIQAIAAKRAAQPFEALRAAADRYAQQNGAHPGVFLANMGPILQHKARADFATGFFEVGGFKVLGNNGFASVEEAASAALESAAPIVVICSTDETYPELVPSLTRLIKQARPATSVLLAGYPTEHIESFKQAGVDEFVHLRANCYELLAQLQREKGVVA